MTSRKKPDADEVCNKLVYGWRCKLLKGHKGDCDYHEPRKP